MLYIRMFFMLAAGLYTSRVVLHVLGASDYGIYNIIGGVVILFSFINNALINATQRFLNFNLGKNDINAVHRVFCMSMNAYFILSLIFIILAETIGLWFVNTQLNIPVNRHYAALWVYQLSVLTFTINLLRIPYNATIIAYERMDFYAYVSLIEVILKLVVVYLLYITSYDKLILYALLYTLVPLLMNCLYKVYCNHNFITARYKPLWDKDIFRSLFGFSGWSLFGSLANMSAQQGINILVNIFYGVTVNAAVGIANQVTTNVYQFISNFQTAFQPQIVKTYATNEKKDFYKLIFRSAKFSYFLMFLLALPIILTTQDILEMWLVEVPEYTAIFCKLILGFLIIECVSAPLWMAVQATGNIKRYQILMAICIFMNFPLTYIVFKIGMPVYSAWIIRIFINILTFTARCIYMKKYIDFPVSAFLTKVIRPVLLVSSASIPIPYFVSVLTTSGIKSIIIVTMVSIFIDLLFIYTIGLTTNEKKFINRALLHKVLKK